MSIVIKGESLDGRGSQHSATEDSYDLPFVVIADTVNATEDEILALPGLPQRYESSGSRTGALAVNVRVQRDATAPRVWRLVYTFSTLARDPTEISTPSSTQSPADRLTSKAWNTEKSQKAASVDIFGAGIVNSMGDPIEGILADESRLCIEWEWNQLDEPDDLFTLMADAINSEPWQSKPAYTWKVESLSAKDDFQLGLYFWRCRASFAYRRDTWVRYELDRGFRFLDVHGRPHNWEGTENSGTISSSPVLLEGNGEPLLYYWKEPAASTPDPVCKSGSPVDNVWQNRRVALNNAMGATGQLNVAEDGFADNLMGGFEYYKIESEIIKMIGLNSTAMGTDVYDVLRGQKGTLATTHASGTFVYPNPIYRTIYLNVPLPFSVFGLP